MQGLTQAGSTLCPAASTASSGSSWYLTLPSRSMMYTAGSRFALYFSNVAPAYLDETGLSSATRQTSCLEIQAPNSAPTRVEYTLIYVS